MRGEKRPKKGRQNGIKFENREESMSFACIRGAARAGLAIRIRRVRPGFSILPSKFYSTIRLSPRNNIVIGRYRIIILHVKITTNQRNGYCMNSKWQFCSSALHFAQHQMFGMHRFIAQPRSEESFDDRKPGRAEWGARERGKVERIGTTSKRKMNMRKN